MNHVTIADVILRRVPLTAREAVTLTLAVAREWDRHRDGHGPVSLPEDDAIHLHEGGDVSFLVTPGSSSATNTLGSLLGRLLGTDETESLRHGAALGVMVKAPGTAGAAEVPTVPDDSFRSVLARFGENDCVAVVAAIVKRVANPPAELAVDVARPRARGYQGPERRRQPRIVAELRLDIRDLERELFALRSTPKPPAPVSVTPAPPVSLTPAPPVSGTSKRSVMASLMVAGAVVCVLALLTMFAEERNTIRPGAMSVDAAVSGAGATNGAPPSVSSAPADVELDSTAATEQRIAKPAVERTSASTRRSSTARRRVAPKTPAPSRPHATFAGGSRSIVWLPNATR
jgi:hypothetical protein